MLQHLAENACLRYLICRNAQMSPVVHSSGIKLVLMIVEKLLNNNMIAGNSFYIF